MAVQNTQMAADAANNSLQPIYSGYVSVKENAAKKMITRYQTLAAQGDLKGYYPSLGGNVVKVFEMTSDISHEDMAIKVVMRPTDEMKAAIRATVQLSVQLGKKQGGITQADALFIEDIVENGNLKYARMFLDYKIRTYDKEAQQIAAQNQQMNNKGAQDIEAVKSQNELAVIDAEKNAKMEVEALLAKNRKEELMLAHQNTMEEIAAQSQGKVANTVVKGHIDHSLQANEPAPAQQAA